MTTTSLPKTKMSTTEVVHQIQQTGNTIWLEVLYERFSHKVYAKCLLMVKNHEDAEDLMHDIWLKVANKIFNFKGQASFATWLYRITVNCCIDFLRQKQRQLLQITEGFSYHFQELAKEQQWNYDTLDNKGETDILIEKVKKVLTLVSEKEQKILHMRYYQKMSIKEISRQLSLKESAVKMRLKRARTKLMKMMELSNN